MIKISPQPKVWVNPEKCFAEVHEDGNLKDGVGIQMGQIERVIVKEATEKGGNGQTQAPDQERNKYHGLVYILCRHNNPLPNPPRTQLLWSENTNFNQMKQVGFRDDGSIITAEGKLTIGIDRRDDRC